MVLVLDSVEGAALGLLQQLLRLLPALHPIAALLFIIWGRGYNFDVAQTTMLVTIAPVGLMALTFAPRYNVDTGGIAHSMLWTMLLSMGLIPVLVVLV